MKKYSINRATWRCGGYGPHAIGRDETLLLNDEGYMCCLGQICDQKGVNESKIFGYCEPWDMDINFDNYDLYDLVDQEKISNTKLASDAMIINDDEVITVEEKEKLLTQLFKDHDIELEFYGESVPYHVEDTGMAKE